MMSYNDDSSPAGRQSSLLSSNSNSRQDHNLSNDLATAVEGLAWGRHQCQHYPHASCTGFAQPSAIEPLPTAMSSVIPSIASGKSLVEYHIQHLMWDHNVLHTPTFISECAEYWETGSMPNSQWAALYLAVLSTTAWSLENAREKPDFVDSLSTPLLGSSHTFFNCMIDVHHEGRFMEHHSIISIQAVAIASMVGNVLGKSDLLNSLVRASISIAQCLGLHHIPDESMNKATSQIPSREMIDREVGRRVWWKLVQLDYHAVPYTQYHCSTSLPSNCDDRDLSAQPAFKITTSTYMIVMAKISMLIPGLVDRLFSLPSLFERYEHVINVDRQMRALVGQIPSILLNKSRDNDNSDPPWLDLARRTLAIAAADKIIMIHRHFLLRSFESPLYLFTRKTCVSAATTILREHKSLSDSTSKCIPIWSHSAFCITAVVVLCLDMLHGGIPRQSHEHQRSLVTQARARLLTHVTDTMARRGVHLIDAML
ncbi:hypothetical protein BDV97DRAFT_417380, partial [Delphinella strobiligena]